MRLILASDSPRRCELLARMGIPFVSVSPECDEQPQAGENPEAICQRLAWRKAKQVASCYPGDLVIGADTIVVLGDKVLGKPTDLEDARNMLKALSGHTHIVKTAVALVCHEREHHSDFIETTTVVFHSLDDDDIDRYLNLDPPLDKAGAYGIQDWSGVFVKQINGCYHNVMGFPLARFHQHLKTNDLWPLLLPLKDL